MTRLGTPPKYEKVCTRASRKLSLFCLRYAHKRSLAVAEPCTEQIDYLLDTGQDDSSFAPIYLHSISRCKCQGNKSLLYAAFVCTDMGTYCRFSASESHFIHQSIINPFSGMLLLRCAFFRICLQIRCNKGLDFWREHTGSTEVFRDMPMTREMLRWLRHSAIDVVLLCSRSL